MSNQNTNTNPETFDFSQFLNMPLPPMEVCACGERTTRVPCFECSEASRKKSAAAMARRVRDATIPAGYRDLTIEMFEARIGKNAWDRVTVRPLRTSMTLFGPAGSGKTTLAVWALQQSSAPGSMFVQAYDVERACRNQPFGSESQLYEQCMKAPVLVVDELATHFGALPNVCHLLISRGNANLLTYVTTGAEPQAICDAFGSGIHRRLFHPHCAFAVRVER